MPGKIIPELLRHLFKREATVTYPKEPFPTPEGFRGKLYVNPKKCVGCKMCQRDCPAQAIEVVKVGEKQFKHVIYMDRCVSCGQCVESCPTDTLYFTSEHELACYDRNTLKSEQGF